MCLVSNRRWDLSTRFRRRRSRRFIRALVISLRWHNLLLCLDPKVKSSPRYRWLAMMTGDTLKPSRFGYSHMECCVSAFKMKCGVCGGAVNKGDFITQVAESVGLELRPRLTRDICYIPTTGSRWVHVGCYPEGMWTVWCGAIRAEAENKQLLGEEEES